MSKEQEKRDNENYAKNFTRVCNIVLESYKHLTHEEKFLYIKMRSVYWDAKPRFATLREISHLTGYTISALSRILPRLHKCGLVHAEIKQEYNPDGSKKGKPKYYITIPDIWELNRKYFECSPEERFDPSVVLLKNNTVPLKNNNVLQKNENVLVENDVVPPEEHFSGNQAPSQARLQTAKDSSKIFKDSKKEETTDSLTHSSTPSLSVEHLSTSYPHVDKQANGESLIATVTTGSTSTQRNTEPLLSAEGQRVRDYWSQLGFESTSASNGHWNTLSKHITSFEQMDSLYEYARAQLATAKDPTVHPGNLVKAVNGWKQKQAPSLVAVGAQQPKPKTKKQAEEEWIASLKADPWK